MILVTGASGLSGSAIMREFSRQNLPVLALVRNRNNAAHLRDLPSVEMVEADMQKSAVLAEVLSGVHRVLLVSSADAQMRDTQCSFIDACKRAGVERVVKFSGGELGFNPMKFRFARMHEEIEDYLENSGIGWTHLRPSQFMQVYLREAPTLIAEGMLRLPLGDISLAPVDIEDIAKVAVAVMTGSDIASKSFVMTGPEALSAADIANHISQATARPVKYVAITPEQRRERLLSAGVSSYFADALYEQAVERLLNPVAQVHLDTHKLFGVEPTTFVEFARRNAFALGAVRAGA
jgi:uncharacterized protein YbjT (DUF2867 family)